MSLSPTANNTLTTALAQNRVELQRENSATLDTIARTLQAMSQSLEALQNENALLRAELAQTRRQVAQMAQDQAAARAATDAVTRQLATQQRDSTAELTRRLGAAERQFATHTHPYYICCPHNGYNCSQAPRVTPPPNPQQ